MRSWKLLALASCLTLVVVTCAGLAVGGTVWFARSPRGQHLLRGLSGPARVNRLLVQSDDGNIYTVRPDGSDRQALTTDASRQLLYRQPTWSPSAERAAWVEIATQEGEIRSALLISRADGRDRIRVETPFPPFFLYWSPDSARLAYLSNWGDGLALRVVDVGTGRREAVTLDEGQPLYFSWAPDSHRLLTHVGNERLETLLLDGTKNAFEATPAVFPAPQWGPDGTQLVYAVRDGSSQRLVVASLSGEVQHEITEFDGAVSFSLSPSGRRIAYALTPRPIGTAAFGPLYVTDLEANQPHELSTEPVLAFFWSPDGNKLIFLRPESHPPVRPVPEAAPLRQEQLWLRWHLWNGTDSVPLSLFSPSDTFLLDYLRFFDQYAQSMTPWAPDSSAFVYAGMGENGFQGIWVHPIAEGSQPVRVTRGVYSAWSPR